MNFEQALTEELSSISGLSTKVFPVDAPEGTQAPYLVYQSSAGEPLKSLEGFLQLKEVSCTINVLNARFETMRSLTNLVIEKIKSFEQRTIGTGGPYIQEVTFETDSPTYFENNLNLYGSVIDAIFSFEEV